MFQQLWQRLFGQRQSVQPETVRSPIPSRSDADYEAVLRELLDRLTAENWGRADVLGFLFARSISEAQLAAWLPRFGDRLLESAEPHLEFAQKLVRLGAIGGHLGTVARGISMALEQEPPEKKDSSCEEAQFWIEQAAQQLVMKDYTEAVNSFRKALAIKNDHSQAWLGMGIALACLERCEEALVYYSRSLCIEPENYLTLSYQASTLKKLKRYKEAYESYRKALSLQPDDHEGWFDQGNILIQLQRYEEAAQAFKHSLRIKPDSTNAWINMGITLSENLHLYQEAISCFNEALRLNPSLYQVWDEIGTALDELGYAEKAVEAYRKAISVDPSYYRSWYNLGITLQRLNRPDEALFHLQRTIEIKPDYSLAWREKGLALDRLRRYEDAIEAYDQALFLQPIDYLCFVNKASVLIKLDLYEEALLCCTQAIGLNSTSSLAWYNSGFVLFRLSRYKAALEAYNSAIQVNKDWGDLNISNAWVELGATLAHLGELEEAIFAYDQALSEQPSNYLAWLNRGFAVRNSSLCKVMVLGSLPPVMQNLVLNGRGYPGQLNTLYEGLKYVLRKNQPDGWGKLHQGIGQAHYYHGRFEPDADRYFRPAIQSYCTALETLTPADFPEAYLEVMLDLIRAERGLGNKEAVRQHAEEGLTVLQDLINQASPLRKRQLEEKFSGFRQFTVDRLIAENQFELALREAERNKNRCLSWILDEWQEPQWVPDYAEMQQFLNESTAVIYWHHSPSQITTFILKHDCSPEVLQIDHGQQTRQFEDWLKGWNEDYRDYRSLKKTNNAPARKDHPWRTRLTARLDELKAILDIGAIESHLTEIKHLILVPHRDLHRLPLHALFASQFTVTYLPSLQIGLSLQSHSDVKIDRQTSLLSVEDPKREDTPPLKFAELESAVITQLFQTVDRLTEEEATQAQVIQALQANPAQTDYAEEGTASHRLFHFTGHAEYNDRQPQFSSLGLTGSDRLTAQTIIRDLDLSHYSLVCLSACETSMTGMATIETDYVGLPSALLQKGVTLVLSTLWTVDEITNAWIIIRFYQELLARNPPVLALQRAQQWLQTIDRPALTEWLLELSQIRGLTAGIRERLSQYAAVVQVGSLENMPDDSSTISVSLPPYDSYHWAGFTLTGKGTQ
jgi:tetratricopeptide (TPR) repeat protein